MDDETLIEKVGELSHDLHRHQQKTKSQRALADLGALNERTPGLPMRRSPPPHRA
jgi:hypothetical protein